MSCPTCGSTENLEVEDLYARLETLQAENDRLRAVLTPSEGNIAALAQAIAGELEFASASDFGRAHAAFAHLSAEPIKHCPSCGGEFPATMNECPGCRDAEGGCPLKPGPTRLDAPRAQLAEVTSARDSALTELHAACAEVARLQEGRESWRRKEGQARAQLAAEQAEVQRLRAAFERSIEMTKEARAQLAAATQRAERAEADRDANYAKYRAAIVSNEEWHDEVRSLRTRLEEANALAERTLRAEADLAALRAAVAVTEDRVSELSFELYDQCNVALPLTTLLAVLKAIASRASQRASEMEGGG